MQFNWCVVNLLHADVDITAIINHMNNAPGNNTTPRPQYVPGSNPATANQGYTSQDFWDGKAGFGAGWSGAEKQEWLQNNMSQITGHNYIPDNTAHLAAVQAKLGQNNQAAMSGMQANPMYNQLANAVARPGADADTRSYMERMGGMYGTGMNRSQFASGLTTGNPQALAAGQANAQKWQNPAFLESYYQSILSPEDFAKWKAQQGAAPVTPNLGGTWGNGFGTTPPPFGGGDQFRGTGSPGSGSMVPPGTGGIKPPPSMPGGTPGFTPPGRDGTMGVSGGPYASFGKDPSMIPTVQGQQGFNTYPGLDGTR